ncbi:hypothetical protein ES703_18009 [subsurface metagenome]
MITLTEAKEIINPYLAIIGNCILNAIQDYKNQDPKQIAIHSKRTRASNISDWIGYHIEKDLNGLEGVHCYRKYGQLRVVYEDKIQMVFKKLDINYLPRYTRTKRSIRFYEKGTQQLEFPDIQLELPNVLYPRRNLVAGYQWNDLLPANVYIISPNIPPTEWKLDAIETLPAIKIKKDELQDKPITKQKIVRPKADVEKRHVKVKSKGKKNERQ